jgi:hypothetical protein
MRGLGRDDETYFDALELLVRNDGTALAKHIEGWIELPRGILFDHFKETDLKAGNPLAVIAKSKAVKLPFSNYLREPTHHHMAKPNPPEWKPLLPGREMELLSERLVPFRDDLHQIDATIKWELAVDNCSLQKGEIKLSEVPIIEEDADE